MVVAAVVVVFIFQKVRIDVQLGIEVKTTQVKHLSQRDFAKMHGFLRCTRVHVLQAVHQCIHFGLGNQVSLADEDLICKPHLAARFLTIIELGCRMLGIHQRQNRVQQIALSDFFVHEEGLRDGARVGQASGFNHDAVKIQLAFALFFSQITQSATQVFTDGAANAAVAHLDDLLLSVRHQNVAVNIFLAKFVLYNGYFLAVRLGQHTL